MPCSDRMHYFVGDVKGNEREEWEIDRIVGDIRFGKRNKK